MYNQSVKNWLEENYPGYDGRVTIDQEYKETEREIAKHFKRLKITVPAYSYKRYGYALSNVVANKFVSSVGALSAFSARLTNCGMAAIETAISAFKGTYDQIFFSPVLYSQTPNVLKRHCWCTEVFEDEDDLSVLPKRSLVFLEPVGNGLGMPVINIEKVFKSLWLKESIVVIDNTLLTCSLLNPFKIYKKIKKEKGFPKMKLVYVESLSKYYRIRDRDEITAGIIVASDNLINKVDEVIMSNGSYLQFSCLEKLPFDLFYACDNLVPELSEKARLAVDTLKSINKIKKVCYPDFPAGGIIYFIVKDREVDNIITSMEKVFGCYKGSFGHKRTSWVPFGVLIKGNPKGLFRLAVGYDDEQLRYRLMQVFDV